EILIDSKSITNYSRRDLSRQIAVSFIFHQVFGNATFKDVVGLGRLPHQGLLGKSRDGDKDIIELALSALHILPFADKQFKEASDGERQKCLLARAFAQQTPILLLDEPTAFLDHPSRLELYKLLQIKSKEEHKSVIVTSHDLNLIETYCDEIWLIGNQRLIKSSDPDFDQFWQPFKSGESE